MTKMFAQVKSEIFCQSHNLQNKSPTSVSSITVLVKTLKMKIHPYLTYQKYFNSQEFEISKTKHYFNTTNRSANIAIENNKQIFI